MPSSKTATDTGDIDIFARGEIADKLKAATSKTAVDEPVAVASAPTPARTPRTQVRQAPAVVAKTETPKKKAKPRSVVTTELSAALGGVSLDDSNLGRPLIELLLVDYREQILSQAAELEGKLKRPALSDRLAMAEFDDQIGQVLKKAITQRRRKPVTTE